MTEKQQVDDNETNMVRITFWVQETEEFGFWVYTDTTSREVAESTLENYGSFFPRGYIIDEGEQG